MSNTPEEAGQELIEKMCMHIDSNCEHDSYCKDNDCGLMSFTYCKVSMIMAKQCALIAVEEIIKTWQQDDGLHFIVTAEFWQSVKDYITKQ